MPKLGKKRFSYTPAGQQDYIKALKRKRALKRKTKRDGYPGEPFTSGGGVGGGQSG